MEVRAPQRALAREAAALRGGAASMGEAEGNFKAHRRVFSGVW